MESFSYLVDDARNKAITNGLQQFREGDSFCDIIIRTNYRVFRCHRIILSLFSSFFMSMFTLDMKEKGLNEITLEGIDGKSFEKVVNFMYKCGPQIVRKDLLCVLHASVYLQVQSLQDLCEELISRTIDYTDILEMWRISKDTYPQLLFLRKSCEDYLLTQYNEYHSNDDIIGQLSASELNFLVASDSICVPSEEHFMNNFINKWFYFDFKTREQYLYTIFKHVRFLTIENKYFEQTFPFWHHPSLSLLKEEIEWFQENPGEQLNYSSPRLKLRSHDSRTLAIIVFGTYDSFIPENRLWKYENEKWTQLPQYPALVSKFAMCRYGLSTLLVSGGLGLGNQSQKFAEFDFIKNEWKFRQEIPASMERMSHCMAVVKSQVYLLGGRSKLGNDLLSVCKIGFDSVDEKMSRWNYSGSLQHAIKKDRQIVTSGDKILLYQQDSCQCYDTVTETCDILTRGIPLSKAEPIYVTQFERNIYILNGRNLLKTSKDDNEQTHWDEILSDFRYTSFDDRRDVDAYGDSFIIAGTLKEIKSERAVVKTGIMEVNLNSGLSIRDFMEYSFLPADIRCRYMVVKKSEK